MQRTTLSRRFRRGRLGCLAAAVLTAGAIFPESRAYATVIRMEFTVGSQNFGSAVFRLYDTAMPRSVANFLSYFDRYNGTFIHRNPRRPRTGVSGQDGFDGLGAPDGNFVVQGGGFEFVPPSSAPGIPTDPPILDEPGPGQPRISNTRGTLSNAKSGPNTVTSQWFVNLGDNSFLDSPTRSDGGFAAFGRVLGTGMQVFDAIDLLQKRDLDGTGPQLFNDVPVGDPTNPLNTLVILDRIEVLNLPAGDYNFDGVVNAADYTVWRGSLGSTTLAEADGNGDGVVNSADLTVWRNTYGARAAGAAVSIPEPASAAALAAVALLGALRPRNR